ncbi:MAG: hypothetical protein QM760_10730 [Nibricoccus sp.]
MKFLSFVTLLALTTLSLRAAPPIQAKTDDGRVVLLKEDGTWAFATPAPAKKSAAAGTTSKAAGKRDAYTVAYNSKQWRVRKGDQDPVDLKFTTSDGDGYAMAIYERLTIPVETLLEVALQNAIEAAPDAEIVAQEKVQINGREFVRLKIRGTIQNIKFLYYGIYGSGDWGTIQLICYTGENLYPEYKKRFEELHSGLEIAPVPTEAAEKTPGA